MNFDYNQIKEEVTSSWSRCLKYNKKREIDSSQVVKPGKFNNHIDNSLKKYFKTKVKEFNKKLEETSCFFLVNENLVIEEISASFNQLIKLEKLGVKKGISFLEKNSGTNAVDLASKLKKPVHMLPGHHFCRPLNAWHSIAYPIIIDNEIYGFINVVDKKEIKDEIICLTELLLNNIELKIAHLESSNKRIQYKNSLSDKQFYILKKIANGLTEKALASDLNLSTSTIKYHKKKLFNYFNAQSNIEMVVKAFKKGFLTFNEVSF